jgi:hypothetical protein
MEQAVAYEVDRPMKAFDKGKARWGERKGMQELVRAFRRFEAHITPPSERFLDDVIRRRSSNRSEASQWSPPGWPS